LKGISTKLVLILLLCTLVVLGLLGGLEFHAGQLVIERQVNQALSVIGKRLSHSLSHPAYDLDRAAIDEVLLGEFPNHELSAVVVWFQGRQEMITGLERRPDGSVSALEEAPSGKGLVRGFWPINRPFSNSPEVTPAVVGEIEVIVDRTLLVSELQRALFKNFTKIFLTVGLLLLVLFVIIRRSLVQPLEHIRQTMLVAEHSIDIGMIKDDEVDRLLQLPAPVYRGAFDELRGMSNILRNLVESSWHRRSELRESDAKYRRLSQEFEAVLDGIVDSLVLLGPDLKVVWGNRGAARQLKAPQDELVGKSCHQFWACDGEGHCDKCVRGVFQNGKSIENIRTAADGSVWGVKGYPILGSNDKVVNVIQIASDLSEKLQLREEAARTAHLAALGGLSAGIAHEINNPTGLVLMALPFVKEAIQDLLPLVDDYVEQHPDLKIAGLPYATFREEILQTVEDMHGGAQRVKRIVEDLKDFSLEKSRDDEEVNLNEMVEKGLRLLQNVVKKHTDHFILEVEEGLPKVRGSSQRLEQVLVNLVQNACMALDSREESVTLKVCYDDVRRKILLQVIDEGCGMPEALLEKITDPFFTTRREEGGTGLGLSVSARIIEEHNGIMKINSEPGQGSVFTLELPVVNGERS
jgi:signal transduction histidine kinase